MKSESEAGGFVRVCKVSDLSDPGKTIVQAGDRTVALFQVSGQFWATDDGVRTTAGNWSPGDWRATPSSARGTARGLTSARARPSRRPPP